MADKKAQRLFLRLISETFFVSDDTLDSKKIDRLVKRLDRLDPIPSSASSAEEALQHWYHTQGIEPPSVELERPRFCSAKKRGKHIWKTIVAPAAILLTLFLVIWVPTNFQQSKTDSAMPNRTAEGEQNAAPQQSNEVGFDNAQSAESKLAAGESQDEEPASQYSGAMDYSRLFNSVDMSLPMGEWLKLKMDAGEPLAGIFVGYDRELMGMTKRAFTIYSFSFLFSGIAIYGSSFFTALNDGLTSALISFLRSLVFQVAAVLILPVFLEIDGIWFSVVAAEMVAAMMTVFFIAVKRKKYQY